MDKIDIKDTLYGLYNEIYTVIDGTLYNTAKNFLDLEEKLRVKYPDKYKRFEVNLQHDYDGYPELEFFGIREETDEEFKKRIELEKEKIESNKKRKEKKEKEEYELFLKLQKKFNQQ